MMSAANTLLQVQAIPALKPHYTDNLMVCGILLCTFIMASVLSDRKHYLARLLKDFFLPRENTIEGVRTTNIIHLRLSMYVVSLASVALLLVVYAANSPLAEIGHGILWMEAGLAVALFYVVRIILFAITNRIFFDSATTISWEQSYACWTLLASIPLYLLATVSVFFNLSPRTIWISLIVCISLLEICLLYKAFHIFSAKKYGILQIFVYLCVLELMPLLVAAKALVLFV